MSEDKTDQIDEYNKDLRTTSGIFGELPASAFVVSEDNPAGVPAPQQVTPGADYDTPSDVDPDAELRTVEDREEEEANAPDLAGPAHAAQAGIVDPSDGTTQTTAGPEDQANLAGVDGNTVNLGESDAVIEAREDREKEEADAARDQADAAATEPSKDEKGDAVDQPGAPTPTGSDDSDSSTDSTAPKTTTRSRRKTS